MKLEGVGPIGALGLAVRLGQGRILPMVVKHQQI